jgi:hypothetical protein
MFATKKAKSLRGNTCAQVFVSDKDFVTAHMMKTESIYINTLKEFAKDVGAPDILVCDASKTQTQRKVKEFCTAIGTTHITLEAATQWAD